MLSARRDQAEGLRRLAAERTLRLITVASATAGVGKTAVAINLAAAIARSGREVLIVDADTAKNDVSRRMAVTPANDLLDVIEGRHPAGEATALAAVAVLPVGRGAEAMTDLARNDPDWLVRRFHRSHDPADVLIVDTSSREPACLWSGGSAIHEVVVLLRKTAASLIGNYALIKAMIRQFAIRRFAVLVTGVANEEDARAAFDNVADAARRYLAVSLRYLGCVPNDEALARADALNTCVVDAFPGAPAAAAFRELARRLMGDTTVQLTARHDKPLREPMKFAE